MIISKTPYRISFFGGGSDYPSWYKYNFGEVISASINKYIYISVKKYEPFFKTKFRITYSKIENTNSINKIQHNVVRNALKRYEFNSGLEINYFADLPSNSGIGSSSSFTVGLINSLNTLKKKELSKENLSKESIFFEQNILKENVGSQDQVAATYGGFNQIVFTKKNKINLKKIDVSKKRLEELNSNLMLFYSGMSRNSDNNAKKIIKGIEKNTKTLFEMRNNVEEAKKILISRSNINLFGKLLHESWQQKKQLANTMSNQRINEIYSVAMDNGAIGGKILGSGNGGFILLYVPIKFQKKLKNKFYKLLHVPFNFENQGTKIIFNGLNSEKKR